MNQLLEIKLQTSPTIDLGHHLPEGRYIVYSINNHNFYTRDIRYIIVDGLLNGNMIVIRYIHVVTGQDFAQYFPIFGGRVQNAKLQLTLPNNFFNK